jgi:serine beta-lactamase-like protein LACTB, mitochondrial
MSKSRTETWLALVVVAIGLVPVAIVGLWAYMGTTATTLHPNPTDVQSVTRSPPLPKWTGAVDQSRQIVRAGLTEQNVPGLSVAVGVGDHIIWAEGFGWADLDNKVPVAPETRFKIGTTSVALTSAAVGMLLEQGHLDLDEDIQTYVPEFPQKQWPVTVRQLMAHVAGVPDDGGDEGPLFNERCERPAEAFRFLSGYEREMLFEPGTQYHYSSYGWIAVSEAVAVAANEPFLTFMQARIFEPLDMRDTRADSRSEAIPNRATTYFPRFAADPRYGLQLIHPTDHSCYAGASVFLSTPSDLVRFGIAINSGKLLQPGTVQMLQTTQRLRSGEETGYGLGWDIENVSLADEHTRWVGHDGTLFGGTLASLMMFPEHGIVVAVTSNISYTDTPALALKIAQAFAEHARSK